MAKKAAVKKSAKPKTAKETNAEKKEQIERLKNTREYAELNGLLMQAPYKKTATLDWFKKHLPDTEVPVVKVTPKERERFILILIRNDKATEAITDLLDLPMRQWKTTFAELAGMSTTRATEKLKAFTPKDFAALCSHNDIQMVKSPKGAINKAKTLPQVLKRLEILGEYLKL